ncbi:MAG: hypothetical protein FWF29_02985 [Treponema sp.]|nr:hypothetical protein [Treponema sp.]
MKKLVILAAGFALVTGTFVSCATVDPGAKYPNMIANLDPFQIGSVDVSFDQMLSSKPKANSVDVVFYPRENRVALEFRHDLIQYKLYWDESARMHFIAGLKQYDSDFSAKTLLFQYNKTRAVYGKIKGKLTWRNFKFTAEYTASPVLELGYRFKDNNPFFTVMTRSAKDESKNSGSSAPMESTSFAIYFTRAQGESLAQLFDQDFLLEKAGVSDTQKPVTGNDPALDLY